MNERIKLLAEQAIANVRFWNAKNEVYDVGHNELEKFAELIVRECAEVAACNAHVSGFSLGDLIKEHFGVE